MNFSSGVVVCHAFLLATLMALACAYRAFQAPAELLIYPACVLFAVLTAWFFWSWRRQTGELLDPFSLFMLAAVLFNGGQAFLQVFHANPRGFLGNVFPPESLLRALFFTMVGLSSVQLGALLGLYPWRKSSVKTVSKPAEARRLRATAAVGLAMIAASVLPWLFVLRDSVSAVMSYGYFVGLFRQEAVTGFSATPNVLAGFLIPGAFFLLAGSGRQRSSLLLATGIVTVYSAVNFFLGSRAPAITALFAMLWLWHRQIHPVRKTTVLAIAAAVVVLLPIVAAIRDLNLDARAVSISTDWTNRMENPLVSAAGEMGSSLSTVAHTMELVPAVREFDLGKSYLYSSLAALPNLFWSVHPTVSHGLLGTWLVWTVDPGRAAVNGGMGFSFLAEAFLNFGWYGAPIALLCIGLALGALAGWVKNSRDPASLAATACILASALIFARGESASVVRGVVWYSLLPFLAVRLLARTQRSL